MGQAPDGFARRKGFTPAGKLVQDRIRSAGESRGFAVSRLLTRWDEVVGPDLAALVRPVDVRYGRDGIGATLTVLVQGAQAPVAEMRKDELRDRVNACYGYRAIARVRITQTAAQGFAEGQTPFAPAPRPAPPFAPDPRAATVADGVQDTDLRLALSALAANVLAKSQR